MGNTKRVLRGDCRERRGAVYPVGTKGAQICLHARATARVGAGDGESGNGIHLATLATRFCDVAGYAGGVTDLFRVGSLASSSRLILGTGGFRTFDVLGRTMAASGSTIATVALRRVERSEHGSLYDLLREHHMDLLPNTAGCYSADEAVLVAELAREAFDTAAIKLEVIGDDITLLPDTTETLKAAALLVERGFEVWAYTSDDLIVAQRLEQLGCVAVMPLGSPIGSGLGIRNPHAIATICERLEAPVLLDAGLGTASDVALAMELGCDGVLAASAINRALDPVLMAEAFRDGVTAGFAARRAGRIPPRLSAEASSPSLGRPDLFAESPLL